MLLACSLLLLSCNGTPKEKGLTFKTKITTEEEKLGYALGITLGNNIKKMPGNFDFKAVLQGVQDTYYGNKQLLSTEEGKRVTTAAWEKEKVQREQERVAMIEKNLNDAKSFLQTNKSAPNVITTASGLQYIELKNGAGPKPKLENQVKINFKATFLDGKEFDSSEKRKGAIVYSVKAALPGVREALMLMPVGSSWRLYLPPELAYGEAGMPRAGIGPNVMLIFEIELLSIEQ